MSMVKCVECGNLISDKSKICVNCGCPTSESIKDNTINCICKINGKTYDFSEIKHFIEDINQTDYYSKIHGFIWRKTNLELKSSMQLTKIVIDIKEFPKSFEGELRKVSSTSTKNIPKCPTCNSTNIRKISGSRKALGAIGFGLLSKTAKSQFECLNCKYKW